MRERFARWQTRRQPGLVRHPITSSRADTRIPDTEPRKYVLVFWDSRKLYIVFTSPHASHSVNDRSGAIPLIILLLFSGRESDIPTRSISSVQTQ